MSRSWVWRRLQRRCVSILPPFAPARHPSQFSGVAIMTSMP
ncbi:hypothetical protein HMPREF9621_01684 [Cutibacterium modestum HL037PA2]|nr:hypothetical protein HMPREF9621_01684 [Cutibacterium modestum HL037PA2]